MVAAVFPTRDECSETYLTRQSSDGRREERKWCTYGRGFADSEAFLAGFMATAARELDGVVMGSIVVRNNWIARGESCYLWVKLVEYKNWK